MAIISFFISAAFTAPANKVVFAGVGKADCKSYEASERVLAGKSTLVNLNDEGGKLPNEFTSVEMITAYEVFPNSDYAGSLLLYPSFFHYLLFSFKYLLFIVLNYICQRQNNGETTSFSYF